MRIYINFTIIIFGIFAILGCGSSSNNMDNSIGSKNIPLRESKTHIEHKAKEWYVGLVAKVIDSNLKSEDSKLGVLNTPYALIKHSLKAMKPFGRNYIDVVFINPVGLSTGEYKSVFHSYIPDREQRWQFTVKTNHKNADILLSWRALYILSPDIDKLHPERYSERKSNTNPLIKYMKLIDIDTQEEIPATSKGYSFNMNGDTKHTFEWVVGTDSINMVSKKLKKSILRKNRRRVIKQNRDEIEDFDLSKPPVI